MENCEKWNSDYFGILLGRGIASVSRLCDVIISMQSSGLVYIAIELNNEERDVAMQDNRLLLPFLTDIL